MNKLLFKTLLLIAGLLGSITASAYDFENGNIYYNITPSADKTVEVTYRDKDYNSYSGSVVIPASVTNEGTTYSVASIGNYAFADCAGLTNVIIGNSVTVISEWAFARCDNLTSVTIGNSVASIGKYAFGYCIGLTNITLPNSVTEIGESAFNECDVLTSVTIGNSVFSIGYGAFAFCPNLKEYIVASGNTTFSSLDGVLFDKDKTRIVAYPHAKSSTTYTIPNSVTLIYECAFSDCYKLTNVTIPKSVTSIGNYAFADCTDLISVTIPNTVASIGNGTFSGCETLTNVTIPKSVTLIGEYAFYSCIGLKEIYNYSEEPQSITADVFDDFDQTACTLYVPKGSMAKYKAADVWKGFGNIQEIEQP